MHKEYDVSGMTCSSCVMHVQKRVEQVPGLDHVSVNMLTNTLTVDTASDGPNIDDDTIIQAVQQAGYDATARSHEHSRSSQECESDFFFRLLFRYRLFTLLWVIC
jgi:Cu+-exporting ATPase